MEEITNFSELGELAEMGIIDAKLTIYSDDNEVKGFNDYNPLAFDDKNQTYFGMSIHGSLIVVRVNDKFISIDAHIYSDYLIMLHYLISSWNAVPDCAELDNVVKETKEYCKRRPWRSPAAAYIANALLRQIKDMESKRDDKEAQGKAPYWRYVFQTFFGDEWGLIQIPIDDTLKAVNESFAPEYRAARKPAGFPTTCQVEAPRDANDGAPGIDERRQEAINKLVAIGMNKDKAAEAVNALQKKANEHNGIALGKFIVDVYDEQNIMKSLSLKAFAPIAREYYGKTEKDRGFSLVNITTHRYSN